MSAGYSHVSITEDRRILAFECCLTYEVLTKRLVSLDDMRKGLSSVRVTGQTLLDLLAKWPELKQRVFPAPEVEVIDAASLRSCLFYKRDDSANEQTREFFDKYIDELSARQGDPNLETLNDLVMFWTGFSTLPFDDSTLTVAFLEAVPSKPLPEANTCPKVLSIPTIHKNYEEFRNLMDKSISYGKRGFGKM
ncbi:uncharacterized protein LOC114525130 [Dendronephthya gigantea]|uniref:uncharacterized protein LOC114525130 n=1 Tax=Dendronephthya gigantea TaxID=151771 RepID=UPI00106D0F01|nr:uncharacterized protein LOC114525130 [Dendronephthya gigantea]